MVLVEVAMLLDLASLSIPPPSPLLQETDSTYGQDYGNCDSGFSGIVGNVVSYWDGSR